MGVCINKNKFVIITESKSFHFNLHLENINNVKHEIDSIIKHNAFLG